jgi:hypothetical protein
MRSPYGSSARLSAGNDGRGALTLNGIWFLPFEFPAPKFSQDNANIKQ